MYFWNLWVLDCLRVPGLGFAELLTFGFAGVLGSAFLDLVIYGDIWVCCACCLPILDLLMGCMYFVVCVFALAC